MEILALKNTVKQSHQCHNYHRIVIYTSKVKPYSKTLISNNKKLLSQYKWL